MALLLKPALGMIPFFSVTYFFNRVLHSEKLCYKRAVSFCWRIQVARYFVLRIAVLSALFVFCCIQRICGTHHNVAISMNVRVLAAAPLLIFCGEEVAAKLPKVDRIFRFKRTIVPDAMGCTVRPKFALKCKSFRPLLRFSLLTLAYVLPTAVVVVAITDLVQSMRLQVGYSKLPLTGYDMDSIYLWNLIR
uniref:G_PROTEIN_RECEP_F1_2 domain-containing protein n=1 Tax=Steinernema glaseri TaxID=37863 RepID=A0A1I7ZS27_9BILA